MAIIDNVNARWGDDLKKELGKGSKLKIAASCFSIYAFEYLKKELKKIDALEFIFTAPAFTPGNVTDKRSRQRREFYIPKIKREKNLYGSEFEIKLKNQLTQKAIAKECAEWIRKRAKFKSNTSDIPMQQFSVIQHSEGSTAYIPIQGFTAVDIGYQQGNAVSNFINKFDYAPETEQYLQLFENIWNDKTKLQEVTETVSHHIESVYQENSPEKIYFLTLYNIFSEFLDDLNEDELPNEQTGYKKTQIWQKLYNFQKDATIGLINKLEKFNGCILADSVGLGKTFTALGVIKYYELRNKNVLVLCPKRLAGNWLNYNRNLKTNIFPEDKFRYDVLYHTDLQRTRGVSCGVALDKVYWENYDLLVIDESHNFRNNDAFRDRETRYQRLMKSVIREGVKTKVLMLSATPVNNKFSDLKNQLALAYEGDSKGWEEQFATGKSVDEIFRNAQTVFNEWVKLSNEERTVEAILSSLSFDFFHLLDSVTIARSRKHIETFYDTQDIGRFPTREKPIPHRCKLTQREDVYSYNEIYAKLQKLTLSIYMPINFVFASKRRKYEELYDTKHFKQRDRETSLRALMTVNLLKRLESSVHSFRLTLQSLKDRHDATIKKINAYEETGESSSLETAIENMENLEEGGDITDFDNLTIGGKAKVNLEDMDVPSWKRNLEEDLIIVEDLLASMGKVSPEHDFKLNHLKGVINEKTQNPINPGNRKVIVFTAFSDTANYLYEHLKQHFSEQGLHLGKVTGSDTPQTTVDEIHDFDTILTLFSPRSKDKDLLCLSINAEIDILIGTDCISEGQNLQDCDYLINYDIHWNPVRIIQRLGRIDRIGSHNKSIQLVNYWPDISLDEYINLKERVENKMVITDITATGDDNVLASQSSDMSYRKAQLKKLQDEVVDLEDVKTGVSITDLGLNDFRMDLLNYKNQNQDIENLPNGLHAIFSPDENLGIPPGVIFVLKNKNSKLKISSYNRLHPYYLVYLSEEGEVIKNHGDVKKTLDIIRSHCRNMKEPALSLCKKFNTETKEGKDMSKYSDLLRRAFESIVGVNRQKDIDSLFREDKTTALTESFSDMDDFELITFFIIKQT